MAGFENDVLVCNNVNFNPGPPPNTGIVTTNGQLLIGNASAPNIRAGNLNQPAAGITVTYSAPNLNLALADDLAAVEGLSTTGMVARTASNTWTTRTLTAGAGISISNGDGVSGNPTISATATSLTWNDVTGTSASAAVNNGYQANNAGLVTITLPVTAAQFSVIRVSGLGAGGWLVAQNASQSIIYGTSTSTTGTGGSIASTNRYDTVELLCVVANTTWKVISGTGNITVT